jgi:probable HAF family extracellular repeat protein
MTSPSANAINDSGQITGTFRDALIDRAFLWTQPTGMRDIGFPPGRESCFGNAINNRGQVVGFCD